MNYTKLYNIENFDKYDNKYAILMRDNSISKIVYNLSEDLIYKLEHIYPEYRIYKNLTNDSYSILGFKRTYVPIYGHFYNGEDLMIAKWAYKYKDTTKYMLVKRKEIFCNEFNHPLTFETLSECKDKIKRIKNDKDHSIYKKPINTSMYENENYELINIEDIINPGE